MQQMNFLSETKDSTPLEKNAYIVEQFSADQFCQETARKALEDRYTPILDVTTKFDRRSVSYQLSKKDLLHSWLKYKEGFSANLVNILLDEMHAAPGNFIMDPFMGSGTTALVCKMRDINCIGFDILPISAISIDAKANVLNYDIVEIEELLAAFAAIKLPSDYCKTTPYITITDTAYPEFNEKFISYATEWINASHYSSEAKNLFTLCMVNSLERCSFTWKSGQYLSWDSRAKKVQRTNQARAAAGKKLLPEKYVRPVIENIQAAVADELRHVISDISMIQAQGLQENQAIINFQQSSALYALPTMSDNCLTGVITSPPYCNRYDYTRTYALELVYLGLGDKEVKQLRQDLLSCTVESASKVEALKAFYTSIGAAERFVQIQNALLENEAFQEIRTALEQRNQAGELNNNGIIRMVEGYFTELSFIYAELYRICKPGATVAFVNDNVRYGGEVIPVDYLSTSLAEQFGFVAEKIYCLQQQKGNSSQQMKKYGRVPLRKSITIWKKPTGNSG